MPGFLERLEARTVLLADGATGTNYQNMGIEPGVAPEEWVVDEPDNVRDLHRRFVAAGSEIVLTCSFGGTSLRLADERLAGRAVEVNRRAAELAREAVGADVLVAGSLGPTGHLTEPLGPLTRSARRRDLCRAGARARRWWRRSARARDVLLARRGAVGARGHQERDRPAARRLVQLRPGHEDDDGTDADAGRGRVRRRSGSRPSARIAGSRSPTPT